MTREEMVKNVAVLRELLSQAERVALDLRVAGVSLSFARDEQTFAAGYILPTVVKANFTEKF